MTESALPVARRFSHVRQTRVSSATKLICINCCYFCGGLDNLIKYR